LIKEELNSVEKVWLIKVSFISRENRKVENFGYSLQQLLENLKTLGICSEFWWWHDGATAVMDCERCLRLSHTPHAHTN
jgi:hypothetical protein